MRKWLLVFSSLFLTSCGSAMMMVSPVRTFATNDSVALVRPPQNFVAGISEIGRSLGWSVSGVDQGTRTITFSDNASMGNSAIVGRLRMSTLTATLLDDRRTVRLEISVSGNFGSGRQEAVTDRLAQFKSAVENRFR